MTGVPEGTIAPLERGKSASPREHVTDPLVAHFGFESAQALIDAYLAALRQRTGVNGTLTRADVERITEEKIEKALLRRHSRDELARRPVYEYASAAKRLLGLELFPEPDGYADPPPGFEDELSPDAFAVRVRGDSMAGANPAIRAGDLVWVDPNRAERREGKPHLAVVRAQPGDEPVAVVKLYRNGALYSALEGQRPALLPVHEILALLPVIAISPAAVRP